MSIFAVSCLKYPYLELKGMLRDVEATLADTFYLFLRNLVIFKGLLCGANLSIQ